MRRRVRVLFWMGAVVLLLSLAGLAVLIHSRRVEPIDPAKAEALADIFGGAATFPEPVYKGVDSSSHYVTMRDGVRIAVDVYLPKGLPEGERVPALFSATRYWRDWDLLPPLDLLLGAGGDTRFFCSHGYAVVKMDARGTGASFGSRGFPWTGNERRDYLDVLDWVASRPWSNGRVGARGVSYEGTAAEFMAAMGHPALKCAAPMFCLYDAYRDIAFPGGVLNDWFVRKWGLFNNALDANTLPDSLPWLARRLVRGVEPVNGKDGEELLRQAVAEHSANGDIYTNARGVTFRDDVARPAGVSINTFSPHAFAEQAERAGTPLYAWGGWFDGAYARALLSRFRGLDVPQRAVIGPWNHGAASVDDPFLPDDAGVQPGETARLWERLRYFDYFLKERGRRPEDGLFYFTLGEGEWKRTDVWPPQGQRRRDLFLAGPGQLSFEAPESGGEETYKVDFRAASGSSNRWRTQLDRGAVRYPDRAERDQRLLLYESSPLDEPLELTGSPVLHLYLALDGTDGAVHAYLEAVDEKGTPRMLTEGTLRMLHRAESEDSSPYPVPGPYRTFRRADGMVLTPGEVAEAAIEMLPTSVLIPRGHRLRLALAGADASQFARIPAQGGLSWSVKRGPAFPSRLDLPVIPR